VPYFGESWISFSLVPCRSRPLPVGLIVPLAECQGRRLPGAARLARSRPRPLRAQRGGEGFCACSGNSNLQRHKGGPSGGSPGGLRERWKGSVGCSGPAAVPQRGLNWVTRIQYHINSNITLDSFFSRAIRHPPTAHQHQQLISNTHPFGPLCPKGCRLNPSPTPWREERKEDVMAFYWITSENTGGGVELLLAPSLLHSLRFGGGGSLDPSEWFLTDVGADSTCDTEGKRGTIVSTEPPPVVSVKGWTQEGRVWKITLIFLCICN